MKPQHKQQVLALPLGVTVEGGDPVALTGIDFERHKHIIGISGSGKSSFLASICLFLLRLGIAFCLLDPHGDLAKLILTLLASSDFYSNPSAYDRLWYVDVNRQDAAIAWNVLKQEHTDTYKVSQDILESIHRAWPSSSGATTALDNTITYAAFVLAENDMPITQLQRFLLDAGFRNMLLARIHDQQIRQFFDYKFADKVSSQLIDSTMRRLNLLDFSPTLRRALSQKENKLNLRNLMDTNTSCIITLGGLSESEKRLAGCLLMTSLEQAFLSRASLSPEKRIPMHCIIDEFPLFSASGESFSVILEQVRKYGGTLYLAHQTTSQLEKGIAGSLQNAISILFKLGYEDSSWATRRFVRLAEAKEPGFVDWLIGRKQKQGLFEAVKNAQQAKQVFEQLARQQAIVTIHNTPLHIWTHTIPHVTIDQKKVAEIENEYARRLLTPLSQRERHGANLLLVSSAPSPLAQRRIPRLSSAPSPLQTFVGAAGTDEQIQEAFSLYGYLTVAQMAKLLQKSENTARNKLNRLVDAGMLDTQTVPRTTPSGKTPTVYTLRKKGVRRYEFLNHALALSDILINAVLLPTVSSDITMLDVQSDLTLKTAAIKLPAGTSLVPDGMIRLRSATYEYVVFIEVDRNSEGRDKIVAKLHNYHALASACDCMTVAFCVVEGGDLRVKTLRNWAADVIRKEAWELFLFASLDLSLLTPETLFFAATWLSVGETTLQPLLAL